MENISTLLKNSDLGIAILSELSEVNSANLTFNQWIGVNEQSKTLKPQHSFSALSHQIKKLKDTPSLKHVDCSFQLHRVGLADPIAVRGILIAEHQEPDNFTCGLICWLDETPQQAPCETTHSKLNNIVLNIPTGIITVNANWECDFINPEFSILTEQSENKLIGKGWLNLFQHQPEKLTHLINHATKYGASHTQLIIAQLGHQTKTLEFKFKARLAENGLLESGLGALIDISERVTHEAKIHRLANYDSITGLQNRHATQENLTTYIENALKTRQPLQLMYLDLDGFKGINDLYGHQVGDKLLQGVAQRITQHTRSSDTVSRFGGDEFIIFVPGNVDNDMVDSQAEKIIDSINRPFFINELKLHISASMGIAKFAPDDVNHNLPDDYVQLMEEDLIQRADMTLYCAKQSGKNQYIRFSNDKTEKVTELYNILQKLPHAIETNLFTMVYQPIVDAKTGKLAAVEALIRWLDTDLQWVAPDKFIPIAESHGKIIPVQLCMIKRVCEDICTTFKHFSISATAIRITINLSGVQLADPENLLLFLDNIQQYGIKPEQITLEITEHVLIEETDTLIDCLTTLNTQGFNIALDDFGTGYSSLSYLARVPISTIKLDKSFVDAIESSSSQAALVKGVIYLAKTLKLKVIAEGVENQAQLDTLQSFGCDYIQGYLIAKPLTPEALIPWLEKRYGH